jgi:hypothetical protein
MDSPSCDASVLPGAAFFDAIVNQSTQVDDGILKYEEVS